MKEQLQGWVLIILLFRFAVELMLIVFNPRLKGRFQPGMREFPESLPSAGFSLLKGCTQITRVWIFSSFLFYPQYFRGCSAEKKEDFMQIKG